METKSIDWNVARFEAIATLALNGLLSNPSFTNSPADHLAQKAVEYARALDKQLLLKPTPEEGAD